MQLSHVEEGNMNLDEEFGMMGEEVEPPEDELDLPDDEEEDFDEDEDEKEEDSPDDDADLEPPAKDPLEDS